MQENTKPGTQQPATGMPCPQCAKFIPIDYRQLSHERNIRCPHCNLTLIVDQEQSQQAIAMLMKLETATRKA